MVNHRIGGNRMTAAEIALKDSQRDRCVRVAVEVIDKILNLGSRIIFNQIVIHEPLRREPVSNLPLQ